MKSRRQLVTLALLGLAIAGCHTDMWRQPRLGPLDESDFHSDGSASRPMVPGTVARGKDRQDEPYYTGAKDGKWLDELPVQVTKDLLLRGQERYGIFCSPCHGMVGDGKGMIAQRGLELRRPVATYHTDRLRKMPVGHFYDVITNGYGAMYSYASRIEPADRWAVVAYVRTLQFSQHAPSSDADPNVLAELDNPTTSGGETHGGGADH